MTNAWKQWVRTSYRVRIALNRDRKDVRAKDRYGVKSRLRAGPRNDRAVEEAISRDL
jgi:hypothetical protein